jgi:hypothetical protein
MATSVRIGSPPPVPCGSTTACGVSIGPMVTGRRDRWWLAPLGTAAFLGSITLYSMWAGLQTTHFAYGSYISPLYSPCIAADCGSHTNLALIGRWWRWSPALLVMAFPIGVRATCYYYRKVYYRAFWLSPPACAVAEPRAHYSGESRFPLVLQNIHRYFWMASIGVAIMLSADSVRSFSQPGGIGVGLGTLLVCVTTLAFWGYVLSCHAFRHLAGGGLRSFADHPLRHRLWRFASRLNAHHGQFAWVSLPSVIVTDAYIRLLSVGAFADPHVVLVH